MQYWANLIVDYLGQHVVLAYAATFLVSMGEALFVIGLFVPSTVVLVGLGALAGAGQLSFPLIFLLTVLGAIVGDALSYWFGHIYKQRIKSIWPISRHPSLVARGEVYFNKHGGKSVFVGRFIPGVKAVIPGIAGMMGMEPWRFTVINIVSAFVWAAAHLLPAVAAGLVLRFLGGMSTRLMVFAGLVIVLLLVALWFARLLAWRSLPLWSRAHSWAHRRLLSRDDGVSRWIAHRLDPDHPHAGAMVLSLLALALGIPLFTAIAVETLPGDKMILVDESISKLFQSLRTAPGDTVMIAVSMLGDAKVAVPVALAAVAWMVWKRAWSTLLAFSAAMISAKLFVTVFKLLMQRTRPSDLYSGIEAYSFPSGHATSNMVLYGILAYIIGRKLPGAGRYAVYSTAAVVVFLIGISRIYLAAHWPSDVLAGLLYGGATASCFALFMGDKDHGEGGWRLAGVVLASFVAFGSLHVTAGFASSQLAYMGRPTVQTQTLADWENYGWQTMLVRRIDLTGDGEEPMILQVVGASSAVEKLIVDRGWQLEPPFSLSSINSYVAASPGLVAPLPTLSGGAWPQFIFVKTEPANGTQRVLRLWPTDTVVDRAPLWLGSITKERIQHISSILYVPQSIDGYVQTAAELAKEFPSAVIRRRETGMAVALLKGPG